MNIESAVVNLESAVRNWWFKLSSLYANTRARAVERLDRSYLIELSD